MADGCSPPAQLLGGELPNDFFLLSSVEGNCEEINFFSICYGLIPASFPVAHKILATFIGYMFCAKCYYVDLKEGSY